MYRVYQFLRFSDPNSHRMILSTEKVLLDWTIYSRHPTIQMRTGHSNSSPDSQRQLIDYVAHRRDQIEPSEMKPNLIQPSRVTYSKASSIPGSNFIIVDHAFCGIRSMKLVQF